MLIDLEGVYVETTLVAVVRASGLNSDQTVIFTSGQDAASAGHLIDMPVEDVIERLQVIQRHEFARQLLEEINAGEAVGLEVEAETES
jgi:hypothetical protein